MEALVADLKLLYLEEAGGMETRLQAEKPDALRFVKSMGVEIECSKEAG